MKKRIWEVVVVCLFCILEVGAASFYARTREPVRAHSELEVQETAGYETADAIAALAEEERNTDGETDGTEGGSGETEECFPVLVWSENVTYGERSCQMRFERIGPLYNTEPETADTPSYYADYRLSLVDADGTLLSEQVVSGFPVRLEEVYWIRDFSGDGFADVAFCTSCRMEEECLYKDARNAFYIWNAENSRYEESSLALKDHAYMEVGPLWNEELSCVITFHGRDWDTSMPVLEMYSFLDGEWQRVQRLEPIGIEGQYHGDSILDYSGKRRELTYENGEVTGEKIVESGYDAGTIWYRPDSVWSRYDEGNLCLYPDERYWEEIEMSVDGFLIKKYVRTREDGETYQREYGDWHDMLEDKRLPYANAETFAFLRDAYADVEFSGELESGDLDTYPLYLDAFYRLFQEEALLTDRETGETMLLSEFPFFEDFFTEEEGEDGSWSEKDRYSFGFFDMEGDGAPELTVYEFTVGYVVLDYDVKEDLYTIWYDSEACWYGLTGSGKMLWAWDGKYLAFYQLDGSGAEACGTFCGSMYYNEEEAVYLVMLPTYAKEEERLFVPEEIQAQGSYSQLDGQWFFRVTGEQYAEITEAFWDAYDLAEEYMERGFDTYEELFGALEDEDVRDSEEVQDSEAWETGDVRELEAWVQEGGNNEVEHFDAGSRTGAHFAAYRVPYDEVRTDREYKDGDYLAIENLDSGDIFYVPDVYGELVDIQVTDSCVCIRDRDPEGGTFREHRIPEYFLFPEKCVLNIRARSHDTILAGTEGAEGEELPQRVWQETFVYGGENWEAAFERISPVYDEGFWESSYGYMADYRLIVRNGEGEVVSEQRISGYPICYEKVHWMIDFSADGFLDVAFCTSLINGTYYHSADTYFLIWDAQKQAYEEKPLPVGVTQNRFAGFVYWVPQLSAVWTDIETDAYGGAVDGMFSYNGGEWELIRKLECIYSETEIYEDPRLNTEYHAVEAYRELYYQGDELVKEKERKRPWGGAGEEDALPLYPGYGWEWKETEIGGVTFYCYYVKIEE